MPKFSIRMMAAAIAVLAVSLGLLRYPTEAVAAIVSAVVTIAIIAAACLAIGAGQPNRSFCVAFVIASTGVLWVNYRAPSKSFSRMSLDLAAWADGYLGWSTPRGKPGATEYYIDRMFLRSYRFDEQGALIQEGNKLLRQASAQELAKAIPLESRPSVPSRDSFASIVVDFSAMLIGLLGGWIAWAARRHTMRSESKEPPAG